jgi:hypothetical protein
LVRYILNIVYDLNLSDKNPPVFFLYSWNLPCLE